jgi:putative transposase
MRAVEKHNELKWLRLYVERWLKALVQKEDGTLVARNCGSPQGSAISPLLANLVMHYCFDSWMGVLVAWGYTTEGKRVLVAVRLGQRESHEDWLDLGRDLTRRGLRAPWLVVSDGAPGLIKAIEELWPEADRGRCAVHKLRNVVAKLPKRSGLHDEVKEAYWAALDEATDPADAERRLRALVAELERPYPSAAACLAEDLPAVCIHLNYFPRLRKRFRSSNLLERSLEEVKRRTKVIGRFPGETSCLSLCWAVLDLFLAGARGLGLSDLEYKQVGPMKIARSHREQTVSMVA